MRQLVDELLGVGRLGSPLDVLARRTGEIAVGDVVGHRVIEQGHLLGHQGDMATQVAQAVFLDIDAIQQDLPLLMVVETRNEVGQG
ncbi:hypothetical protein D9M71_212860 [compost metagenome]